MQNGIIHNDMILFGNHFPLREQWLTCNKYTIIQYKSEKILAVFSMLSKVYKTGCLRQFHKQQHQHGSFSSMQHKIHN